MKTTKILKTKTNVYAKQNDVIFIRIFNNAKNKHIFRELTDEERKNNTGYKNTFGWSEFKTDDIEIAFRDFLSR